MWLKRNLAQKPTRQCSYELWAIWYSLKGSTLQRTIGKILLMLPIQNLELIPVELFVKVYPHLQFL